MSKNNKKIEPDVSNGVDMVHIKDLMGPLPNEKNAVSDIKQTVFTPEEQPKTAPELSKTNKVVAAAAEEANESLKAAMPGSDDTEITPVSENEELDSEFANSDIPDSFDSLSKEPEAGAAEVDGDGVATDDAEVVKAVNDISSQDSDSLLEAEDEEREATQMPPKKPGFKAWCGNIWKKPGAKWGLAAIVLLSLLALAIVPTSRYFILNSAGVRASVGVTVIDNSTLQPLKNVTVSIGNTNVQTDSNGAAKLDHIKLGKTTLQVSKRAFTSLSQDIVVGWGSNPRGQLRLVASGIQYSFTLTDFLSGKPIDKAEAVSGEGNAKSDKNGRLILSLDTSNKSDSAELDVQISAANYRSETIKITAGTKASTNVKMVPSAKDVYVSNRSGKYDIYTIDIDGKNDKKIVSGTGIERADISLAMQQGGDLAAFVATRENARNTDGFLLSTLYLVDAKTGSLTKIDQSEQINLVGWASDGHLVYVKIAAGASASNTKRFRLKTVNSKNTSDNKEIASANAFNDVVMAGDKILYAPSNSLNTNPNPGMFIVNADGNNSMAVTNKEVTNIFRTDYNTVTIFSAGTYYSYKIGAASSTLTAAVEPKGVNRLYVDNLGGNKTLWLDNRTSKGALMAYDKATQKDSSLSSQVGLKTPIYWLNNTVAILRINDGNKSVNYAISTDGGDAKKIQDVSDVAGIGRWYYY